MINLREKDRDISILDYFNVLQQEYLYFELKTKVYPSHKDKAHFRKVMELKRSKIEDIADKNRLTSMFNDDEKMSVQRSEFYNDGGIPKQLGNRDWYYYYKLGSDFSYQGKGVKLFSYDRPNQTAVVIEDDDEKLVDITEIARIL